MHRLIISPLRVWSLLAVVAALCLPALSAWGQTHAKRAGLDLRVTNNHGQETLLAAGLHEAATKGLDASVGEQELPPVPPAGIFDVRLVAPASGITLGEGSTIDYRPWPASGSTVTENYRIQYQAGRTWNSVTLLFPATFSDNIRSVRADNKTVKGGDSVVASTASGEINLSIEFVLDPVTFTVAPQSVIFTLGGGDTSLPAMKTVRVTPSSATAAWTASASESWIDIDRYSGTGAMDLQIGINHLAFEGGRTSGEVLIRQALGTKPLSIPVHVDMVTAIHAAANPLRFTVDDAYPNPVSVSTGQSTVTLEYTLADAEAVSVTVFDALGRVVRTLDAALQRTPGRHLAIWNLRGDAGERVAPGVYRVRLTVAGLSRTRAIVVR